MFKCAYSDSSSSFANINKLAALVDFDIRDGHGGIRSGRRGGRGHVDSGRHSDLGEGNSVVSCFYCKELRHIKKFWFPDGHLASPTGTPLSPNSFPGSPNGIPVSPDGYSAPLNGIPATQNGYETSPMSSPDSALENAETDLEQKNQAPEVAGIKCEKTED